MANTIKTGRIAFRCGAWSRIMLLPISFAIMCIAHTMNSKDLIKQLEQAGWRLQNVKGSHHVYRHPELPGHISVPHPKKALGIGLVTKLLRHAGMK